MGCVLALAAGLVCRAQDTGPDEAQRPCFKRWFSLEAVGATVPGAVLKQVMGWPEAWGRTRPGFEKRAGSLYAQFVIGTSIEDGVKVLHKEDTRYRRLGKGSLFRRTRHGIAGAVTAGKPGGGRTVAWSLAANAYGSSAIATLWSPAEYRTAGSILERGAVSMAETAGTNLLKEFWPDFKRLFRKRK